LCLSQKQELRVAKQVYSVHARLLGAIVQDQACLEVGGAAKRAGAQNWMAWFGRLGMFAGSTLGVRL
jgi:hypothetical protein